MPKSSKSRKKERERSEERVSLLLHAAPENTAEHKDASRRRSRSSRKKHTKAEHKGASRRRPRSRRSSPSSAVAENARRQAAAYYALAGMCKQKVAAFAGAKKTK